jgi:ribosome-binding factor A
LIDKSVKLQKTEALLQELLVEALGSLSDPELSGLSVVDVDCSRGKYNAKVYLDESFYSEAEQREILKRLKKASGHVKSYCAEASGWYRSPDFSFIFDDRSRKSAHMDDLFKQIEGELAKNKEVENGA